jgi:HEAT repeat protein
MIFLAAALVFSSLKAKFCFSSTERLMELVSKNDDRLAALELGQRKVKSSVPLLIRIAREQSRDINLRHNAIKSLGEIGPAVKNENEYYDSILACLFKILRTTSEEEKYLRGNTARVLGDFGDKRAVMPLILFLENEKVMNM